MTDLAEELATLFEDYGYVWKVGNGYVTPTVEDIDKVLDKAKASLYASKPDSTVETGRLIVQKITNTRFAVYLHIGDTK